MILKSRPTAPFAKRGLYETFQQATAQLKVNGKKGRFLLGLSGGRDSVVLLHLLLVSGHHVTAAHLNHQLRGNASRRDEAFVRKLCKAWKVKLFVQKEDIQARASQFKLSIEEAARIARYRFFNNVARKANVNQVLVAHHQKDQAETVLLKIFFGCNRDQLRGMEWDRPLPQLSWQKKKSNPHPPNRTRRRLMRPLLNAPESELQLYARQNHIPHVNDLSNKDLSHPRNWIRHQLLPQIEKHLKRNVTKTLARLGNPYFHSKAPFFKA